jgi:AcrR family transcriptional regulator
MLSDMTYEQITVKELTDRARINRKTFYLHYPTMDDLLAELQEEMAREFVERTSEYNSILDMPDITREFFLHSSALDKLRLRIISSNNGSFANSRVTDIIMKKNHRHVDSMGPMDDCTRSMIIAFLAGSTIAIYQQWQKNGKQMPMEDAISLTSKLICEGVFGLHEQMKNGAGSSDDHDE